MPIHCRLETIMAEKHLTVAQVCKRCAVNRSQVCALRRNEFKQIGGAVIDRICRGLDIRIEELFVVYREDPFHCIRLHKDLTVHLGANCMPPPPSDNGRPFGRHYYGSWDVRSLFAITGLVNRLGGNIVVGYREHDLGADTDIRSVKNAFRVGNHLVVGSPVANPFAEYVLCGMHGVPPFTPSVRDRFPVNLVWDAKNPPVSSFGYERHGGDCGIISLRTGRLVGRRTFVEQGEGEDCGLIVVLRLFQPPALRRSVDDYRVIVCVLGHSGPGTLAAMKVAVAPKYASALWPEKVGEPLTRVVWAKYTRHPNSDGWDNRQLTACGLVDPAEYEAQCVDVHQSSCQRNGKAGLDGRQRRPIQVKRVRNTESEKFPV